jgi:hypothetical protein
MSSFASGHPSTIFQPSDLNRSYRAILDLARKDRARVRDTDGLSILVIPEERVSALEEVNDATASFLVLEDVVGHSESHKPTLNEFGPWPWLRFLDPDDLTEFVVELRGSLVLAVREQSSTPLRETLQAWRDTAEALSDPARRAILLGGSGGDDFIEVSRPEAPQE